MTDYKYTGNIRMYSEIYAPTGPHGPLSIIVYDLLNDRHAPTRLEVRFELAAYIRDLMTAPAGRQETVMRKRFYFNKYCELLKVEVLDDAGEVVKTVDGSKEWLPLIGTPEPEKEGAEDDGN